MNAVIQIIDDNGLVKNSVTIKAIDIVKLANTYIMQSRFYADNGNQTQANQASETAKDLQQAYKSFMEMLGIGNQINKTDISLIKSK